MTPHEARLQSDYAGAAWVRWSCNTAAPCRTLAEHIDQVWWPCEQPERPLDAHALFEMGCTRCDLAYDLLGCPVPADSLT